MFVLVLCAGLRLCRILFAYGRDRLVPAADWWGTFNHRTHTPQNAVWGATGIAMVLGLPMLGSSVAFESLLSLSAIALFILYAGERRDRAAWPLQLCKCRQRFCSHPRVRMYCACAEGGWERCVCV